MSHKDDHQHETIGDGTDETIGDGAEKADGLGGDGTIPNEPDGLGATIGEASTFEHEEDEHAEGDDA